MIAITYTRAGITHDFLRFTSTKFMRKWMKWAIPDATNIKIKVDAGPRRSASTIAQRNTIGR